MVPQRLFRLLVIKIRMKDPAGAGGVLCVFDCWSRLSVTFTYEL